MVSCVCTDHYGVFVFRLFCVINICTGGILSLDFIHSMVYMIIVVTLYQIWFHVPFYIDL